MTPCASKAEMQPLGSGSGASFLQHQTHRERVYRSLQFLKFGLFIRADTSTSPDPKFFHKNTLDWYSISD